MLNSKIESAATSLIEDLKSQDTKTKINAIKSLTVVSLTIGKERTRNELLPYIADSLDEEDEEALIELAKVLSSFLEYVGGKQHAASLFKLFELLITSDDYLVRCEGLTSFKFILFQISQADYETELMGLIKTLMKRDYPHHKIAGMNLISTIYPFFNEENKIILKSYVTMLTNEESAIIKKEVSFNIKDFCSLFEIDLLCTYIQTLQKDTNDSVRIYLMESIVSLRDNSDLSKAYEFISCTIIALSKDESWRVRLTVADKIHELLTFPDVPEHLKQNAIEIFANLITDPEGETRNMCCTRLETIADLIGMTDDMNKILIQLKKIEKDATAYVRSSLANSLLRLAPLVGKTRTNDYIFPIFLNMINDESHDIRMILIKNLDRLHEVVNVDMYVQSIIPSLFEIASNKSWRVRVQITESITVIARILNKNLFMENIFSICIGWLTDNVQAIREIGCKLIKKLYDLFKCELFEKRLVEKLNEMKSNNYYLIRNTVIILGKEFANDEFDLDFLEKKMAPIIFKLCRDKISNIRVNSAALIKKMSRLTKSKEINKEISIHLEELKRDSDLEVIYAINDN